MKPAVKMTDEELEHEEYCESCRDDGFGSRLRELRMELLTRKLKHRRTNN